MEISDDLETAPSPEDVFENEILTVFQETLGLVHIALVSHYQLSEQEATELEKDLFVWFRRFCYRPGASVRENRPYLLVACCQFAREYQRYVVGTGVRDSDERLSTLLEREPSDVAHDFSRSLQLFDFRRSDA
ncbi:MAG TPA: hypothetical protein VMN82_01725 [Thermoanaerobaculia bacterium]|nr:hypothetical protein [Thermoanaerobaculia bacterium]